MVFYKPKKEELWFRQRLLSDEATMSYNRAWGGTIPFPADKWEDWFERWILKTEGQRFYRYLLDEETGAFLGEAAYYYDAQHQAHMASIIVEADKRGRGYGEKGLLLLCEQARRRHIAELYDSIALDNPSLTLFLKCGFTEQYRTDAFIMVKKKL